MSKMAPFMNEYYLFIVRELSMLDQNTGENRREMYARARKQLVSKLHRPPLRVSESEIAAEYCAFDAAVRMIELELANDQKFSGVSASIAPPTPLTFLALGPITRISADSLQITRIEAGSLQISRAKSEATQIYYEGENESASPLELHRRRAAMLRAIGTPRALELAARHELSAMTIEKEGTNTQMAPTNYPDPVRREQSARAGETTISLTHAPLIEIMSRDPLDADVFKLRQSSTGFVPRVALAVMAMPISIIQAIVARPRKSPSSTELVPSWRPPIAVADVLGNEAANLSAEKPRAIDLAAHQEEPRHAIERLYEANSRHPIPGGNSAVLGETTFAPIKKVTPQDTVVDLGLKIVRPALMPPRTHGVVAVFQVMGKQLISMMRAIVVCCIVFMVTYFVANIEKWFGF